MEAGKLKLDSGSVRSRVAKTGSYETSFLHGPLLLLGAEGQA